LRQFCAIFCAIFAPFLRHFCANWSEKRVCSTDLPIWTRGSGSAWLRSAATSSSASGYPPRSNPRTWVQCYEFYVDFSYFRRKKMVAFHKIYGCVFILCVNRTALSQNIQFSSTVWLSNEKHWVSVFSTRVRPQPALASKFTIIISKKFPLRFQSLSLKKVYWIFQRVGQCIAWTH
jgi:hypothetical protein